MEAPEFSTAALLNILARHSFPPERLVIELTEQQPVIDIEKIRLKLETCRAAGMGWPPTTSDRATPACGCCPS